MKMNLYVWDEFCNGGYSDGLAFAVAETKEQAVEKVDLKIGWDKRRSRKSWGEAKILSITDSVAFACEGVS